MKKLFSIIFILFFLSTSTSYAVEEKTTIRVGISNNNFSTFEHSNITFVLPSESSIIDMAENNSQINLNPNSTIEVSLINGIFQVNVNKKAYFKTSKGPIVITAADKIGIKDLKRKGTPAYYKGMIELTTTKPNKFNVINILDMQTYLKGVVPNEMPIRFGYEALRAQAVAARNYANRPRTNYSNYDVCDSTACQVYYGVNSQTEISDKAVDSTQGIYALFENEIILALYSSTASGISGNYFETFGNFYENRPYLTSVTDNRELEKMDEEEYFKTTPPSFDMNSPRYRWERKFDRFELEEILSKTLIEQSKNNNVYPKFTENDKFYGLEDIKIIKKGAGYKALEVEIKSVSGDYIVKKELPIRRVFKQNGQILSSANFIVEKEYGKIPKEEKIEIEVKNEDEVIFEKEEKKEKETVKLLPQIKEENDGKKIYRTKLGKKLPKEFIFYGAGFGHGIGMSQYGAGYLSSYGVDFENILKHYYRGINLGTIPKTVSYNNVGINFVQEFYFQSKKEKEKNESLFKNPLKKEIKELLSKEKRQKCFLVIENYDKVSNVEFFINDFYFNPEIKGLKKSLKTDISNYLTDGVNKIIFKPLNEDNKKKTLNFYIVFGEEDD